MALAACATQQKVTVSQPTIKYRPVPIPSSLLSCPSLPRVPNPDRATDAEVGDFTVQLYGVAKSCKTNLRLIKEFEQKRNASADK